MDTDTKRQWYPTIPVGCPEGDTAAPAWSSGHRHLLSLVTESIRQGPNEELLKGRGEVLYLSEFSVLYMTEAMETSQIQAG